MADEPPKVIGRPPTAHTQGGRRPQAAPDSRRYIDGLEATELSRMRNNYSHATASYHAASVRAASTRPPRGIQWWRHAISSYWRGQISMVVDHEACRDHLSLERTFLGYVRTSLVISMIGVAVAQLFRLTPAPNDTFGFYVLGKPLACICQACAIYSLLLGAYRVWRHQHALVRGKAVAGGFEVFLLGLGVLVLCMLFFILLVAIDVNKDS